MSKEKDPNILYSVSKTTIWFLVASVILAASLLTMVWADHSREWKAWQKKFVAMKTEKAKTELEVAEKKLNQKTFADTEAKLKAADADLTAHHKEHETLRKEIEALDVAFVKAKTRHQDLKQFHDSYLYYYEEYSHKRDARAAEYRQKLDDLAPLLNEANLGVQKLEAEKESKTALYEKFIAKKKELEKLLSDLSKDKESAQRKLNAVKPTIAKDILNAPMLDFVAPSLTIQQVVLEDLYDDYHFTKVQKIDRCTTCHLGIDQKGFEDAPQPFRTHPKLDLYLGSASPHPVETFGCTVCHGGNGHSVSFKDSAHMPSSDAQAKDWEKKYRWEALEKWKQKMLPTKYIESSCAKCHSGVVDVPEAPKLNEGRQLARELGCLSCHKVQGFESPWKVGPDLTSVASKLDPEWMKKWIADPRAFRASTRMPQIFHLSNTDSPEDRVKSDAAIEAVTHYLLQNSTHQQRTPVPAAGDATRGEKLVKELGCLACHSAAGSRASEFAPELSGLGSKVTPEWLYSWLKNPKHFSPDTRMPNLRLSDEEAADITSYLLSLKNEPFESRSTPKAKEAVLDEMAMKFLSKNMRVAEAKSALGKMDREAKLNFLGKQTIAHQGCYACHAIQGFEDAKPIGAELTKEGQKDLHQFDFGFSSIDHTRESWIFHKLKEPRLFDEGKVREYHDKLRMPDFGLTDEEAEKLTTFVLSLREEPIPYGMKDNLDLNQQKIEAGRLLVKKLNCQGCHTLDGQEGSIHAVTEDAGQAPPALDGEGAKVQEKWLYHFLENPTVIRPWIRYRMPTFNLSEEELETLVAYFAHQAHQEVSYSGKEIPESSPEKVATGKMLVEKFQCMKCHQVNALSAAMGSSFLAPDLRLTQNRLKPEWVKDWLKDPQALQEGTMMPGFFPDGQSPLPDVLGGDAEAQIEAIRDYLYRYEREGESNPVEKK